MTMLAFGATSACSNGDLANPVIPSAGSGGAGGSAGASGAGAGGTDTGGTGGTGGRAGNGGTTGGGGSGGSGVVPPTPALPVGSPTLSCPAQISGSLEATDARQTGRHSRIAPVSACGASKSYPSNSADPTNPHLFDVYRFSNTSTTATCFTFTLTDGVASTLPDAGVDAGADAAPPDETPLDAGADSGGGVTGVATSGGNVAPDRYMTAYRTFYPSNLALEYQGDVGGALASPQSMAITVPAGGTIDVVIYAIAIAPGGVGPYTLTCSR